MRTLLFPPAVLLLCAAAATTALRPPATPPPNCVVQARLVGPRSVLGSYLLEIRVPDTCPSGQERLARIITNGGGRIPPIGYFRLSGAYSRKVTYWVFPGARVEDRAAPNVWNAVPLKGAPAWW
ncbi:hypothetical protein [Deinococcus soli (ex Cha et al. 2016)]|uniref:hypothetical protein n=1 Tax=Deinococcus soli (ex Cha et al. 2016) TaxID=1309411 RepID=UPI00166BE184|nr:hypothetical protein [Deinococcus soli (ex Cha et al. 2016)]GGB85214.1 hypothetical protein GCM10008019_46430 [Deinococcus soli (ex Cha et al. 2016)]